MNSSPGISLPLDELRAVTAWAVGCATPTLSVFERACPDDRRPAEALAAGRAFAGGGSRTRAQRTAATQARRAAVEAPTEDARYAALATADAVGTVYLRPTPTLTQLRHILGAPVHAARAAELARGDDHVVAEHVVRLAAGRVDPVVRAALDRYPRAPVGRSRIATLLLRIDGLIRDPAPPVQVTDDPGPFFHGTRADLRPGDLLTPGWLTNYGTGKTARHIYVTAKPEGAILAATMAAGDGPPRVYRVEPLADLHDDPNVTDMRFPGNPTRSYRTTGSLRVVDELDGFEPTAPETIARIRASTVELATLGVEALD